MYYFEGQIYAREGTRRYVRIGFDETLASLPATARKLSIVTDNALGRLFSKHYNEDDDSELPEFVSVSTLWAALVEQYAAELSTTADDWGLLSEEAAALFESADNGFPSRLGSHSKLTAGVFRKVFSKPEYASIFENEGDSQETIPLAAAEDGGQPYRYGERVNAYYIMSKIPGTGAGALGSMASNAGTAIHQMVKMHMSRVAVSAGAIDVAHATSDDGSPVDAAGMVPKLRQVRDTMPAIVTDVGTSIGVRMQQWMVPSAGTVAARTRGGQLRYYVDPVYHLPFYCESGTGQSIGLRPDEIYCRNRQYYLAELKTIWRPDATVKPAERSRQLLQLFLEGFSQLYRAEERHMNLKLYVARIPYEKTPTEYILSEEVFTATRTSERFRLMYAGLFKGASSKKHGVYVDRGICFPLTGALGAELCAALIDNVKLDIELAAGARRRRVRITEYFRGHGTRTYVCRETDRVLFL